MSSVENNKLLSVNKEIICKVCNKSFRRGKDLKSHSVIHLDAKPFACTFCPEAFKHNSSLKRHSLIHLGEKPFSCRVCGKAFRQKGSLNEHLLTHTGEKPHICEVCRTGFTTKGNYIRHLRTHLEAKPFTCTVCDKGYNVRAYLLRHYKTHEELCKMQSISVDNCADEESKDVSSDEKSEQGVAQPAPDVFVVSADVTEVIDPGAKEYLCNICKRQFKAYNNFKSHYLSHINDKSFTCNLCSKTFLRISTYCKHKLTHKQERLACIYCGNSYTILETLQRHLKTHAGNLIETRDVHSEEFIEESKQYFENNVLKKRFICSVCNRTFIKEVDFMQHSLIHKISGPFECDVCSDKVHFDKLNELHEHYTQHDGISCDCFICTDIADTHTNSNISDNNTEHSIHKCSMCHKCFQDVNLLVKHYSFHKTKRPFLVKLTYK